MKLAPVLLSLSLVANVALAVRYLRLHPHEVGESLGSRAATAAVISAAAAKQATDPNAPIPIDEKMWLKLGQGSDADYVARLRGEGFPPHVIRTLVEQRVHARYADRLSAFESTGPDEYWRGSPWGAAARTTSPEARAERRSINREIRDAVKVALGPDGYADDPDLREGRTRIFGDLPQEKIDQMQAILSDYDEMSAAVRDRMKGFALREDREQLRLLEKERRADLEAMLTPTELAEYDLRSSPSAASMRNRLMYFKPSEAEYRALTQIQLEFDRRYGTSNLSEAEEAVRRAAEKDLTPQMQAALTPERFAEYQLVTDPSYRNTADFLRSYNFDEAVARQVATVQRDIATRATAIRAQGDLAADQRAAALAALASEAGTQLEKAIGKQAFAAYQDRGPGGWVKRLVPPASHPSTPSTR